MGKKKQHNSSQSGSTNFYDFRRNDTGHILGIDFTENAEQRELIRLIQENKTPIIYCFGQAGTGKTFTALAASIDLVKIRRKYTKIYYIREPIEVGKSLGYLPGTAEEKISVYGGALDDNIEAISNFSGINKNDLKSCIEILPPQYTRGRSFQPGTILIIDESQNLTLETIQTLLTRVGKFSKIILLGSVNQIDLKNKTAKNNDFLTSFNIISEIESEENIMDNVTLVKSERSDFCALIDDAFTKFREQNIK